MLAVEIFSRRFAKIRAEKALSSAAMRSPQRVNFDSSSNSFRNKKVNETRGMETTNSHISSSFERYAILVKASRRYTSSYERTLHGSFRGWTKPRDDDDDSINISVLSPLF